MVEGEVDHLRKAIEGLHRCSARLAQSVPVKEMNKRTAVWDGVVPKQPVSMHGSAPVAGTADQRQFFAVLLRGWSGRQRMPVRAAIAAE
jgi:hypothetical protein